MDSGLVARIMEAKPRSLLPERCPGITIGICTYNGAARLPALFSALVRLDDPGVQWEVVIVDNGSSDNTALVARQLATQARTQLEQSIRVVVEVQPGVLNARLRAFKEARFELVAFLDDDNIPRCDWLRRACASFGDPNVVAVGGPAIAVWPDTAPTWFAELQQMFACGDQSEAAGRLVESHASLWTAGAAFRVTAVDDLLARGFAPRLLGRTGTQIISGEDVELCLALRLAGGQLLYEPELVIEHVMTAQRGEWSYVLQLARANGYASPVFEAYWAALGAEPRRSWRDRSMLTLRALVRSWVIHPSGRQQHPIRVQRAQDWARLRALLRGRGRWDALTTEVASFPWTVR